MRIKFVEPLFLCLALALAQPILAQARKGELGSWSGDKVVKTSYGFLRGYPDAQETIAWRGVAYARPPVGSLRWQAPQEPKPWSGIRNARGFGPSGLQFNPISRNLSGSEDCLYLNVWRKAGDESKLPVYVWIHGGGNSSGSASMVSDYYGHGMASKANVVFVSINYRLGPLGWFRLPRGPAEAAAEGVNDSGNFGSLDIIQALRWIKENIGAFGGDPERIVLAGESSGGQNVLSLLVSPMAKGLFQAAIVESGYAHMYSQADAEAASQRLLAQVVYKDKKLKSMAEANEVAVGLPYQSAMAYLRSKSALSILKTQKPELSGMLNWPSLYRDGQVLASEGFGLFEKGQHISKVPLIIGTNKDETKLFLYLGKKPKPGKPEYERQARAGSDYWKAIGADQIARDLSQAPDQPPIYVYRFDWGSPDANGHSPMPGKWGRDLGAFHSLEIPFFLGTSTIEGKLLTDKLFTPKNRRGRQALSSLIMSYTMAFVATGDPNSQAQDKPKIAEWRAWSAEAGSAKTMVFDAQGDKPSGVMEHIELWPEELKKSYRDLLGSEEWIEAFSFFEDWR